MKNKRVLKVLATAMLTLTICVGFAESKTELMGDNYVRFGSINLEIDKTKFVDVVGDQIYFVADGSNENITEYCSAEDYYVKQLVLDDYIHTIIIGGDILGNISQEGGVDELGFVSHVELIGELEREVEDLNIKSESLYRWPTPAAADEIPVWFINACNDYGIADVDSL